MRFNLKHFVIFITIVSLTGCKQGSGGLDRISGKEIGITDSISGIDSYDTYITPYRQHIDSVLDDPLAYSKKTLSKNDGKYNTAIGNLLADIVYEQSDPVFFKRTGNHIDVVLINFGGIRSIISKGAVSRRTAFEVMPFENTVLILELTGVQMKQMADYLRKNKPHPFRGMKIVIDKDHNVKSFLINGEPVADEKTYFVATSNYLAYGGDGMYFLTNPVSSMEIDYLIRNEMIDYFTKVDTIDPVTDDRFIQLP
ncbi:5'-nucleotidase C-terminal domain-containing protein [Robertkochia solimangrovi]|uniref:5'-nucleotidase C-terminal domain-containing protein n=1 Tax=Robertkochia solimangrovi TaxID=2213046 RepID=UPI00118047E3|nr:5'-nucleotidase [Robertkochia solimangrovi]TRZ41070.1 hypothetical protein DMZ48_18260 [Robertkochia solimangrovi]